MWLFMRNGPSGFSSASTAEEVLTNGIDASGLNAIVTGASSGIGLETARVLAKRGVHVVMGIRNMGVGEKLKQGIIKANPAAKVDAIQLDLSSMQSVRNFVSQFTSSGLPLNILINNAGIMVPPFTLSPDNIELQFATNYLGHFLLTHLLLDTMKKTARDTKREGRIVNLSSVAHRNSYTEGIRFDKINDEKSYSKLILHANELARWLKEEGADLTANSVHPGVITTNLFRHLGIFEGNLGIFEGLVSSVGRLVLKNVQQVAPTTCYVALHPQLRGVSGEYFSNNNLDKADAKATDKDLAAKLWDYTMDLINK
ncbi:short-chain dehydrogenase TIC 32, chloroplastic-like [Salvia splendens]|uniref:short-chain dehydrogenase TIC 32, chloroplastic-like n=1 Tax=Salvia splendens TaxID=180675 RepID=UPI001C27F36C|nr:short-chain dehydrogenase TIC 32, chloroplastic-like [Salvia splendens]